MFWLADTCHMFSPETEFCTLVSEYRRLVEKYAGKATDVSTVPTSSGVAETLLVDDLQTIQLASPFNVPLATSVHPDSVHRLTDQATNKLGLGASMEAALSRVLEGLKDKSSSPVQEYSNQSWSLHLASLEYAKSLGRFSLNSGLERPLASGTTLSTVEDFVRTLQSKLEALHSGKDIHKRKDGGNCNEHVFGRRSLAVKKPRLVWTEDLHKRFEEAVHKLGNSKAVPKAILEVHTCLFVLSKAVFKEMNIDGLTRENIASHLQKYRQHQERQKIAYENRKNHGNLNKDVSKEVSSVADSPEADCDL